jgi:microfibrillar-associated protein 1
MTQSSLSESANARTSNSGSVQGRIRTVKVAVVGSGLAGLTASYLLASANGNNEDVHFDVHLFEKVCGWSHCDQCHDPELWR